MTVEDTFAKRVGRQASEAERVRLYRLEASVTNRCVSSSPTCGLACGNDSGSCGAHRDRNAEVLRSRFHLGMNAALRVQSIRSCRRR
jgi:hypothetical protein